MSCKLILLKFQIITVLSLLLSTFMAADLNDILWPLPKTLNYSSTSAEMQLDPCSVNYKVVGINKQSVIIINQYKTKIFKCSESSQHTIQASPTLYIVLKNSQVNLPYQISQEKYELFLGNQVQWTLFADYYTGFLRGFETYSQLFQKNQSGFYIKGFPISIQDSPDYPWRGLMIDSARHFIPVPRIKHTIDGMLYNKMNVLHWHIVDEDSFPVYIPARPELGESGKLKGIYYQADLRQIIQYARIRGIRVVPQFDSPAHTTSWARSQNLQQIALNCNNIYKGQFDPSLDLTYKVLEDVMQYFNQVFDDTYVHFGGDQVTESCWDQREAIKEYMKENNISDYVDLQVFYRKKQKKLSEEKVSRRRRIIYWANQEINLPVDSQDIIQWWGEEKSLDQLAGFNNSVILSTYDQTYLDVGFGDKDGTDYRTYITWREVYKLNPKDARLSNMNVLGGQVCMWSEMVDECNHDQKIWIRSSSLAERLWNIAIDPELSIRNIATRLIAQKNRMKARGFKTSAVSVGLCEKDPSICF